MFAEEVGFTGVCINEEHQNAFGGLIPSPNVMASAVVSATRRVIVGILSNCLPLRGNPVRVAEEIAMLDILSNGRIVSGFVRGAGCEYFNTGFNPATSRKCFLEAHDLIIKAWTERTPFSFYGEFFETRSTNIWPRPMTKPHPPIWIPTSGSAETLELAAKHRYPIICIVTSIENVSRIVRAYRDLARTKFGYIPEPKSFIYAPRVYLAEADSAAQEQAALQDEHFRKMFASSDEMSFPPGYVSENSLARMISMHHEPAVSTVSVVGSVETVTDQLISHYDELGGFGRILVGAGPGVTESEQTRTCLALFQREVVPKLSRYHEQRAAC